MVHSQPKDNVQQEIDKKQETIVKIEDICRVISDEVQFLRGNGNLLEYHRPLLVKEVVNILNQQEKQLSEPQPTIHIKSEKDLEDELLAQEEAIAAEIRELQRQGLWSTTVKQVVDPPRNKTHWDYALDEVVWLAKDFHEERKWKLELALKNAKNAVRHHNAIQANEKKKQKEEERNIKGVASKIARTVKKDFWGKIHQIVMAKHKSKVDETKAKFSERKMDYLVQHTEQYSQMIAKQHLGEEVVDITESSVISKDTLNEDKMDTEEPTKPKSPLIDKTEKNDDDEFGEEEEEDDETTLAEEENLAGDVDYTDEIAALENENDLPIEEIMKRYYGGAKPASTSQASTSKDNELKDEETEEDEDMVDEDEEVKPESSSPTKESEPVNPATKPASMSEEQARIQEIANVAQSFQPTGFTLATSKIQIKLPFLLSKKLVLREYQQIGLNWLVTMYEKKLNGILADEMGLGKTIQTISLLAYLACEKHIWGQHLIVVPSSVMLNWEIEFKKWCPGFKILTYYGNQKERALKRKGWNNPDTFDVCITSYNLVVKDKTIFKRKKWHYLILDEAHHIKNFKSQCWQTLLNFNTEHRLLLTGTPLQNNVMELWSLMHFSMPEVFQSHSEFKEYFSNPLVSMVEGSGEKDEQLIQRLHTILRPFILRRLKKDVEKQMPSKYEHIEYCKLSKRQRILYEDYMSRADTRNSLTSGNVFKIINILMQLRKVCDHPDLFETRPIVSPFQLPNQTIKMPSIITKISDQDTVDLEFLNLNFTKRENKLTTYGMSEIKALKTPKALIEEITAAQAAEINSFPVTLFTVKLQQRKVEQLKQKKAQQAYVNEIKCDLSLMYGADLIDKLIIPSKLSPPRNHSDLVSVLHTDMIKSANQRVELMSDVIENFVCNIPKARVANVQLHTSHPDPSSIYNQYLEKIELERTLTPMVNVIWRPYVRTQVYFPDKRLLQYDCGKLQVMAKLLKKLKDGGHRVLIFTQMSKMLDILEAFLCMHGYMYFRLDGSTKVEQRQYMTERFNTDNKIFAFILSTRSGGLGLNLTGADTVIFYDSDWNPAMDLQAQDRCHRIGQTRDVHIYRLVSESTIEERILMKANQKKEINNMVIQSGGFNPDFFKNKNLRDIFSDQPEQVAIPANEEEDEEMTQNDLDRMMNDVEDKEDVEALKKARKEETETYSADFDEIEKDKPSGPSAADIDGLLPIHKFAIAFLEMRTIDSLQSELKAIEEEERVKEQEYKLELDIQHKRRVETNPDDAALTYEIKSSNAQESEDLVDTIAELMKLYQRIEVEAIDDMYKDEFMSQKQYKKLHEPPAPPEPEPVVTQDPLPSEETILDVPVPTRSRRAREPKKKKRRVDPEIVDDNIQVHEDELQQPEVFVPSALDEMPTDLSKQLVSHKPVETITEDKKKKQPPPKKVIKKEVTPIVTDKSKIGEKDKKKKKREDPRKKAAPKIQIQEIREYPWMPIEDEALQALIRTYGTENFDFISSELDTMFSPTPVPRNFLSCQTRHQRLLARKELIQAAEAAEAAKKDGEQSKDETESRDTSKQSATPLNVYLEISKQNINRMLNIWFPKKEGQGRGRKKGPLEKKITKKATKKPIRPKLPESAEYKAPLEIATLLQKAVPPNLLPDYARQQKSLAANPPPNNTQNTTTTTTIVKGGPLTSLPAPMTPTTPATSATKRPPANKASKKKPKSPVSSTTPTPPTTIPPAPPSTVIPSKPPAVLVPPNIASAFPTPNTTMTPTPLVPSNAGTFTASFAPRPPSVNPMAGNPMFARATFPTMVPIPTTTTAPLGFQTMLNAPPTPATATPPTSTPTIAEITNYLRTALANTNDQEEKKKIASTYMAKYPQLQQIMRNAANSTVKKPPEKK